jgi:hypothetical protein
MNYTLRNTCRLCASSELECVLSIPDTPVGDAYVVQPPTFTEFYPLSLNRCCHCGNLQLGEVVAPAVLYGAFTYRTSVSVELGDHFRSYASVVSRKIGLKPGDWVLDIGSNDGTLLSHFQAEGYQVLGIDPAVDIAREASKNGIETIADYFSVELAEQLLKERGHPRLILSNNTFANIDNLQRFVEGVKVLMRDDSVFVFETGHAIDLCERSILDNIYHEHLNYFLINPLVSFFKHQGMWLTDVEQVSTKGGSIRCYVGKQKSNREGDEVRRLCQLEVQRGALGAAAFHSMRRRLEDTREQLHQLLSQLSKEGEIAGFGASVGVTTLLYYFGIADFLSVLVDDNPRKHGLFSPGCHLEVVSGDRLKAEHYPNTLILPWRYADIIRSRRPAYTTDGGRFHVPLPEVKSL